MELKLNAKEKAAAWQREWCKKNPEKVIARRKKYSSNPENALLIKSKRRLKLYGVSEDDFQALKDKQNGVCAICEAGMDHPTRKELDIDHCHITGVVRGLLCNNCNRGIGHLKDDPYLIRRALIYLEQHKGNK